MALCSQQHTAYCCVCVHACVCVCVCESPHAPRQRRGRKRARTASASVDNRLAYTMPGSVQATIMQNLNVV